MKLKTFLIIYGIFVASVFLQGCEPSNSYTTTGSDSDIIVNTAGEDVKTPNNDASREEDNSVIETPEVVE